MRLDIKNIWRHQVNIILVQIMKEKSSMRMKL